MKKITTAAIRATAKKLGLSLELVNIRRCSGSYRFEFADLPADLAHENLAYYDANGCQLPEVEKRIDEYNQTAAELLEALGCEYWGLQTGTGAWDYELGGMSTATRLALDNID